MTTTEAECVAGDRRGTVTGRWACLSPAALDGPCEARAGTRGISLARPLRVNGVRALRALLAGSLSGSPLLALRGLLGHLVAADVAAREVDSDALVRWWRRRGRECSAGWERLGHPARRTWSAAGSHANLVSAVRAVHFESLSVRRQSDQQLTDGSLGLLWDYPVSEDLEAVSTAELFPGQPINHSTNRGLSREREVRAPLLRRQVRGRYVQPHHASFFTSQNSRGWPAPGV